MRFLYCFIIKIVYCDNIYTSFEDINNQFIKNAYNRVLIVLSSKRCPPCRALHNGPLKQLENNIINKNKKLLIVTLETTNNSLVDILHKLNIKNIPDGIPSLFLLKYNKNKKFIVVYESLGYDMYNPQKWLENMTNTIVDLI